MLESDLASGVGDLGAPIEGFAPRPERPWLFGLLIAPSAVVANGVIQGGVLAYLLTQQGVGIGRASQIIWLLALPTSIYFLWSPLTDFLVRRRTWLLLGAVSAGVLMAAAFHEKDLSSRTAMNLIFLSACCSQLVVSSCGGMMGALSSDRTKRVASSFYQGGSMAFGAAAVWVLLRISSRRPAWMEWAAAALIAGPGLFALAAPKQAEIAGSDFGGTMQRLWVEFKTTFLRWAAIPYMLTMLFPMGSGSAVGLLPGIAKDYGVNGDHVGWMNGIAGAVLVAAGSLAATTISARVRASVAYLTVCLINAAALCVLWLGPLTPMNYYIGVTLYLFTVGTCYAMFTAVVLEFMGDSGKSGSGRYSIINSLGNVPVLYMIALDGWGGSRWGARGLSATDAVVSAVAATILLAYFLTRKRPA